MQVIGLKRDNRADYHTVAVNILESKIKDRKIKKLEKRLNGLNYLEEREI